MPTIIVEPEELAISGLQVGCIKFQVRSSVQVKTTIKNGEGQVETVRPRLAEQGDQTCGLGGVEHEGQADRLPSGDRGQADKVRTFLVERYCPLDQRVR